MARLADVNLLVILLKRSGRLTIDDGRKENTETQRKKLLPFTYLPYVVAQWLACSPSYLEIRVRI